MPDTEHFAFEADGQVYEVTATPRSAANSDPNDDYESYGVQDDAIVQLQRAHQMIRACATYTVSAFKNFSAAEVQEVNLKFGIKLGGKIGIPYITEGSSESNVEISVKCTFIQTRSTPE
jgi:TolB-like protein